MGWPDEAAREVRWGIRIPGMLSFLLFGDASREVPGLDKLGPTWGVPPVWLTFQSYHLMVGIGMLFIASTLYASALRLRGTLFDRRWLLWYFVFAVGLAVVANEVGWVAAEVGRQPWIVYPTLEAGQLVGGLRTSDALSEAVGREHVLGSIIMFGVIYSFLFVLWIVVLNHKIQQGPELITEEGESRAGVIGAISERVDHQGSMTEAKEEK